MKRNGRGDRLSGLKKQLTKFIYTLGMGEEDQTRGLKTIDQNHVLSGYR